MDTELFKLELKILNNTGIVYEIVNYFGRKVRTDGNSSFAQHEKTRKKCPNEINILY